MVYQKKKKNDRRTRRDEHGAKVKVRKKAQVERIRDTKDEKSCMYIILQKEDDLEIL